MFLVLFFLFCFLVDAEQIEEECKKFCKFAGLKTVCVVGGQNIETQVGRVVWIKGSSQRSCKEIEGGGGRGGNDTKVHRASASGSFISPLERWSLIYLEINLGLRKETEKKR